MQERPILIESGNSPLFFRQMVYLIGVEHIKSQWEYQNGSNKKYVLSFTNIVRNYIKALKVTVIAEELNEECLEQQGVEISTAQKVAREFGAKHIFCEPLAQERAKLGVLSKEEISQHLYQKELWQIPDDSVEQKVINKEHQSFFTKRERFWFDKIEDLKEEVILFICGKSHIKSFKQILEEYGLKVTVLSD